MKDRANAAVGLLVTAVVVFSSGWAANGQVIISGQNAFVNVGSAGARAPGLIAQSGVARFSAFGAPVRITDPSRPTSVRAQALADSIDIVFRNLNVALTLLENLLLARANLTPLPTSANGSSTGPTASAQLSSKSRAVVSPAGRAPRAGQLVASRIHQLTVFQKIR